MTRPASNSYEEHSELRGRSEGAPRTTASKLVRAPVRPAHFGERDYTRDRADEENERRLQQLEDEQPDPTYAPRGPE